MLDSTERDGWGWYDGVSDATDEWREGKVMG